MNHIDREDAENLAYSQRRIRILNRWLQKVSLKKRTKRQLALKTVFESVLDSLPKDVQDALNAFWGDNGIELRIEYFKPDAQLNISMGKVSSDAWRKFEFHIWLIFAPEEVVRAVMAHEIAHVFINTSPQGKTWMTERHADRDFTRWGSYPPDLQEEERAVSHFEAIWGFQNSALELWETAIECNGEKWEPVYKTLLAKLKSAKD